MIERRAHRLGYLGCQPDGFPGLRVSPDCFRSWSTMTELP